MRHTAPIFGLFRMLNEFPTQSGDIPGVAGHGCCENGRARTEPKHWVS